MDEGVLSIRWDTGFMDIRLDSFFPCEQARFKKLLKVIDLDWEHSDTLKDTLKVYFQQRILPLKEKRKKLAVDLSNAKQAVADLERLVKSRKKPVGVYLTKAELEQAKEDLKAAKACRVKIDRDFRTVTSSIPKLEKLLEIINKKHWRYLIMAIDFDKINRSVDLEGLRKDVENASANGTGDFPTIPAGKYEVALGSMEIKGTKADPNRPMLAVSFKILTGEYKNQRIFMNRVLLGTKNDVNMIKSAEGWLASLDSGVSTVFEDYKQFNQVVMDVAEAIDGKLEYAVDYDPDRFNSISVEEVFEVE